MCYTASVISASTAMMPILFIRVLFLIFGWPLAISLGTGLSAVPPKELVECLFAGAGRSCMGVHSQNKRPAPCPSEFFESSPSLITSLPFSLSVFQNKNRPLRITLIQSSRLHHWLPLSQVPILKGRSSAPLPSSVFVYAGHTTRGDQKIQYSKEHNKVG